MANARQIVKRRKAVSNTRKITRTMQLIATARYQQAFKRATETKPYTEKITQLVHELSAATSGKTEHGLMRENTEAKKDLVLVLTANRGLCGGYNTNILRRFEELVRGEPGREREIHVVGKKGIAYCRFFGHKVSNPITEIDDRPRFEQVEPLASDFMERYVAGEFANVYIVYMKFYSAGRQTPEVMHLLPLRQEEAAAPAAGEAAAKPKGVAEYEFSPEPEALLAKLLPQTVKIRMFQAFTDMAVSENVARMVAMKAATDAAGDMIKSLSRQYNRARQTQITMELLDIVGGAEALN